MDPVFIYTLMINDFGGACQRTGPKPKKRKFFLGSADEAARKSWDFAAGAGGLNRETERSQNNLFRMGWGLESLGAAGAKRPEIQGIRKKEGMREIL